MRPPFFEVLTHSLHIHRIELGRIIKHSKSEAVLLEHVQCVVEMHRVSDFHVQVLEALLPRRVIAVGAAVNGKSPNVVSVLKQLLFDPVGFVGKAVTTRYSRSNTFSPEATRSDAMTGLTMRVLFRLLLAGLC